MTGDDCKILNVLADKCFPSDFKQSHHIHILVYSGSMQFSDGKNTFCSSKDDFVIWQMSNNICQIQYSEDFNADFLIVSPSFLQQFNPEMLWASKGFIFIRINPSFHLNKENKALIQKDFSLFKDRLNRNDNPFHTEVIGRILQIFLYDLWYIYRNSLSPAGTTDNYSRIFLNFINLAQTNCRRQRDVVFYADELNITPKYLSEVCRKISGLPASQWITYFSTFELISLLNDTEKTISEISDLMNFSALSFFSRYTKKVLGKTPTEYRQK